MIFAGVPCLLFCLIFSIFVSTAGAVTVSSVSALQDAVNQANNGGDKNIVISSSGSPYHLGGVYLRLTAAGITVSGESDNREDVVLDGDYSTTEIFQIVTSNVTIKNLTLKRAYDHPIHIFPQSEDVVGVVIDNVHIIDPGQQAIKINQNSAKTYSVNGGVVKNSRIELSDSGRAMVWERNGSCYTGGVDGHHTDDWNIRDNVIVGFWCEEGLSEHGVHFWSFSQDTVVERNWIINCDRGIGFGLGSSGHVGGIIRNNMIYHDSGHAHSDVGISLESASSASVYNNTVFQEHSYPNAIEYRFSATSGGSIRNNLTNRAIIPRNDGTATLSDNVTSAQSTYFNNVSKGDLHLASRVPGIVDSGVTLTGLTDDFDGQLRSLGGQVDIGADELVPSDGGNGENIVAPVLLLLDNK